MEFEYSITSTVMPFGRYKGIPISKVPTKYLDWWGREENMRKLKDPLIRAALGIEIQKRKEKGKEK